MKLKMPKFLKRNKIIFYTYTPGEFCQPGTIHEVNGKQYLVSHWVDMPSHVSGLYAPSVKVMGKEL